MKDIVSYILEGKEKEKWFRFEIKGLKGSEELIKSIEKTCNNSKLYCEKIDKGIKVRIKDNETNKTSKLTELLSDFINTHQEDSEYNTDAITRLLLQINDYVEDIEDGE